MATKGQHGKVLSEVYLHIDNGGITFGVVDTKFGPAVQVSASHYGHLTNDMLIYIRPKDLKRLGALFEGASEYPFQPEYFCHAYGRGPKPCLIKEHRLYHLTGGKCPCVK